MKIAVKEDSTLVQMMIVWGHNYIHLPTSKFYQLCFDR